jgi:hypothetical protein
VILHTVPRFGGDLSRSQTAPPRLSAELSTRSAFVCRSIFRIGGRGRPESGGGILVVEPTSDAVPARRGLAIKDYASVIQT